VALAIGLGVADVDDAHGVLAGGGLHACGREQGLGSVGRRGPGREGQAQRQQRSNFYVSYRFLFFVTSSNVFKDYWIFTVRRQFLC
jgi:hypothetical protein